MVRTDALKQHLRENEGVATVEFAIILSVLLLLILGVLEFGLVWYAKYAITNATREGARYGVIYHTRADGSRMPPCELSPSIAQVVGDKLTNVLPTSSYTVNVVNNIAYQTGQSGTDLTVQVTFTNPWDLLGGLIPSMRNMAFTAQTVMKCE
jgi:Flp pilus assembly protein TadG